MCVRVCVCGSVPARVVDVRPSNVTLLVGASASLVCSASGDPVPLVRWLRHDADELAGRVAGEPGVGHGLLAISNATLREDGWYECEADNGVGAPHRRAVYVDVLGTPAPGVCRERGINPRTREKFDCNEIFENRFLENGRRLFSAKFRDLYVMTVPSK